MKSTCHAAAFWVGITVGLCVAVMATGATAQEDTRPELPAAEDTPVAPKVVDVLPTAADDQIAERLMRIFAATEWFQDTSVEVDEGVAILRGRTQIQEHKEWASRLAQNTQDVVAVVNRIEVTGRPLWDFSPATQELRTLWRETVQATPLIGLAFVLLAITWVGAWVARRAAEATFRRRIGNALLRQMAANVLAVLVLILGVYIVLKVSGLTRLAVTVLGGTGLFGLIMGIAFRDIAENYLASILLSVRRPFEVGDLIDVEGKWGIVRTVTTRGTMMITFEGNHIHIPNSIVYKSVINNYSANPNLRLDFTVGIGYDDAITQAQEVAVRVLREHPAVLADPEPMVLVEQLGTSSVVLKPCFWVNIREHSMFKVRSAVIRLVKRAFQDAGISMPDEAREMIFPQGVPVRLINAEGEDGERRTSPPPARMSAVSEDSSSAAEGGLQSETDEIEAQARQSRPMDLGENLLGPQDKPDA